MITMIKNNTGCMISVGQNGFVWIDGEKADDAIKIIKVIDPNYVQCPAEAQERLKAQGITMNEALVIVDALMVGGVYTKEYAVTKKHVVKFKTRDMEDQGRFIKDLESDSPMYTATTNAMLSRHNLTASLVSFRGSEFKNYEEALAFVVKLPEPIFRILIDKLRKFDMLVFTVMDEGALENF